MGLQDSKKIPQTEADYNWTSSIKIDILYDSEAYIKTAKIYAPVDKILLGIRFGEIETDC